MLDFAFGRVVLTGVVLTGVVLAGVALAGCGGGLDATIAPCRPGVVAITLGQFGVGRGHFGGSILFSNDGHTTCTLAGYPSVRVASLRSGDVAVRDVARGFLGGLLPGTTRLPVVTLAPHAVASAVLEGSSHAEGCLSDPTLRVGIPDAQATTRIALETSRCSHLEIHPIVPGSSGAASP
jgi:Protein of unknown function (DUF4232)